MQNSVRAGRSRVHGLAGNFAMLETSVDDVHRLVQINDRNFDQVFHKHLSEVFTHIQVAVIGVQQVLNLVLVNLKKADVNLPLSVRPLNILFFDKVENEVEALRNDALTLSLDLVEDSHSVSLTGSCLPVHKVNSVVAFKNVANELKGRLFKQLMLLRVLFEDMVELEFFGMLLRSEEADLVRSAGFNAGTTPPWNGSLEFLFKRRSQADVNFNVLRLRAVVTTLVFLEVAEVIHTLVGASDVFYACIATGIRLKVGAHRLVAEVSWLLVGMAVGGLEARIGSTECIGFFLICLFIGGY